MPSEEEYAVSSVVGIRCHKGLRQYLVRWEGWGPEYDEWVDEDDLACPDLVHVFLEKHKARCGKGNRVLRVLSHRRDKRMCYEVQWREGGTEWVFEHQIWPFELVLDYWKEQNLNLSGDEEFGIEASVERILDFRKRGSRTEFLVKWETEEHQESWIDQDDILDKDLIKQFYQRRKEQDAVADNQEYEIEKILCKQRIGKRTRYLVRWKGWTEDADSWVAQKDLRSPELLREFEERELEALTSCISVPAIETKSQWAKDLLIKGFTVYDVPKHSLTPRQIKECRAALNQRYEDVMHTVKTRDMLEVLCQKGFQTFKFRRRGRVDFQIPELIENPNFSFLFENQGILSILEECLGSGFELIHVGSFLSFPGAETQEYHRDGDTSHASIINIFIPLVDLVHSKTSSNGPTEFIPGSHSPKFNIDPSQFSSASLTESCIPLAKAGQAVLFDYAVFHRGLANLSDESRPVIYVTYGRKGINDLHNFSHERFAKLPEIIKPSTRTRAERSHSRSRKNSGASMKQRPSTSDSLRFSESKEIKDKPTKKRSLDSISGLLQRATSKTKTTPKRRLSKTPRRADAKIGSESSKATSNKKNPDKTLVELVSSDDISEVICLD